MNADIAEAFGPNYPSLPSVAKWRKLADRRELTKEESRAYGAAVMEGIRKLQRDELMRALPSRASRAATCASGTFHNDAKSIQKAVRQQHIAKLQADAQADRARRTDEQIITAYAAALEAKRAVQVVSCDPKPVNPFINADGSYNRGAIMREAHVMARSNRADFPGRSYSVCLSIALRAVWAKARNMPLKVTA